MTDAARAIDGQDVTVTKWAELIGYGFNYEDYRLADGSEVRLVDGDPGNDFLVATERA